MEVPLHGAAFFRVRRVLRRLVWGPGVSGREFWSDWRTSDGGLLRQGQRASVAAGATARVVGWVLTLGE
jgi:hypothetical protein